MLNIGIQEYIFDSISTLHVYLHSYGWPLEKMKPSSFSMIAWGTFVYFTIPLEDEHEETIIRKWIYHGEEEGTNETSITTKISPK